MGGQGHDGGEPSRNGGKPQGKTLEYCLKVLNKPLMQTLYMKGASILTFPVPCEISNVLGSKPE